MEPPRPNPEQLLHEIEKDALSLKHKGKLKIFFGACAGAGKTYAMLLAAHEKIKENFSVVAGIIETHSRLETARLLEGIPVLPLLPIQYQGITLQEFDLDAALQRKPAILLVDELAHTNVAEARHPKRWQDVQELLESGIDVYTTLNVQHLESLNDTITNLTGIRVKETVPDSIFDNADEIVLVDIPSEIILERLKEGKVYLGEFAKARAAQHFFKIDNLMALREMALRRTAERVDALRDIYKKYKKSNTTQLISDNILVCIGPKSFSTKLIRLAKQQASRLKCPWTALYVENEKHYRLTESSQLFIEKTLRQAEQLGGKKQIIQATHTVDAIIHYARTHDFTRIIIGKPSHLSWQQRFFGSLVNDLINKSGPVDILIVNDQETLAPPSAVQQKKTDFQWASYLHALIVVIFCTLMAVPFKEWLEPENAAMIYLAGIIFVAANSERNAAILASLLSVAGYKIFFTPPFYHFKTYHLRDIVTLAVLFLIALVISNQTSKLRLQNMIARQREKYTASLYTLSRKLIITSGKNKIAKVVSEHIGEIFDGAVTIWLPDPENYLSLASHPGIETELKEASVAQWAFTHHQAAGWNTNTMPSARGYYLPLSNGEITLGVLGIILKDKTRTLTNEEKMMLEAFAIQAALAFERTKNVKSKA